MNSIDLRRSDPRVKALLAITYPEYTGRKIELRQRDEYVMEDYWSGGSRTYVVAVDLATMKVAPPATSAQNPFNRQAHSRFAIPDGVAMVEHSIFCGRDSGIRIVVNSATFPKYLPGPDGAAPAAETSPAERDILAILSQYTSEYKLECLKIRRTTKAEFDSLAERGLITPERSGQKWYQYRTLTPAGKQALGGHQAPSAYALRNARAAGDAS